MTFISADETKTFVPKLSQEFLSRAKIRDWEGMILHLYKGLPCVFVISLTDVLLVHVTTSIMIPYNPLVTMVTNR